VSQLCLDFVIYDKSQVTVQDDNHLYCMSASESNGCKWQTNINNDDGKTRVDISRADHFVDEVHEAGHVLNPLRPYQPRLTDGFICVVLLINFFTVNLSENQRKKECISLFNVLFFSGRDVCKDKSGV
jgi:hypothetical protein